jgi:hypothetical protein
VYLLSVELKTKLHEELEISSVLLVQQYAAARSGPLPAITQPLLEAFGASRACRSERARA